MSIDKHAAFNRSIWSESADEVCEKHPDASAFREAVASTRIGTNVDAKKVIHFCELDPPCLVSTPSMHAEGLDDYFSKGTWGPRREAVEVHLEARGEVVYGTLDLSPMTGDPTYGPYRLVYGPREDERLLVLPHNSAGVYGVTGTIDDERIHAEVADWESRSDLATAERGAEAAKSASKLWPELLANEVKTDLCDQDLIEVLAREGRRELGSLNEIRVSRDFLFGLRTSEFIEKLVDNKREDELNVKAIEVLRGFSQQGLFKWKAVS